MDIRDQNWTFIDVETANAARELPSALWVSSVSAPARRFSASTISLTRRQILPR